MTEQADPRLTPMPLDLLTRHALDDGDYDDGVGGYVSGTYDADSGFLTLRYERAKDEPIDPDDGDLNHSTTEYRFRLLLQAQPTAGRFRKTATIDAVRWVQAEGHPDVKLLRDPATQADIPYPEPAGSLTCSKDGMPFTEHGWINTLEGGHIVCPGDWIATGVEGEHWPIKDSVFRASYEPADASPTTHA